MSNPGGRLFESAWITPYENEVTTFMGEVFRALEAGQADTLQPDPFYVRADGRPPLTDEQVDDLIVLLDQEYDNEMERFASHHLSRSGAEARTEMHRLPPAARRYLAEGVDEIVLRHESIDQEKPPEPPGGPEYTGQ